MTSINDDSTFSPCKYLTKRYDNKIFTKVYHNGKYNLIGELDFNIDNFTIDNSEFRTFESFSKSNDYVIYIDNRVCYFKFYVTDSNNEVFATEMGDYVLTPYQVKNMALRLHHK
jgi:hypothetical protein